MRLKTVWLNETLARDLRYVAEKRGRDKRALMGEFVAAQASKIAGNDFMQAERLESMHLHPIWLDNAVADEVATFARAKGVSEGRYIRECLRHGL